LAVGNHVFENNMLAVMFFKHFPNSNLDFEKCIFLPFAIIVSQIVKSISTKSLPNSNGMAICTKYTLKQVELAAKKDADHLCRTCKLPLCMRPVM
jgi:hypothetical protein